MDIDLNKLIAEMTARQSACSHSLTGVWPRSGPPVMSCFACGFVRPMTAEEMTGLDASLAGLAKNTRIK